MSKPLPPPLCQQPSGNRLSLDVAQLCADFAPDLRPPLGFRLGRGRGPPVFEVQRAQLGPPLRCLGPCRLAAMHTAARLARNCGVLAGRPGPRLGPAALPSPIRSKLPEPPALEEFIVHHQSPLITKVQGPRSKIQGPRTTNLHPANPALQSQGPRHSCRGAMTTALWHCVLGPWSLVRAPWSLPASK